VFRPDESIASFLHAIGLSIRVPAYDRVVRCEGDQSMSQFGKSSTA
jgi:hypothetical protein